MPLQIRRTTKKTRLDTSPGRTFASRTNDCLSKTVPRVILLHVSSLQDQCLVQQVQDRHSWFTRGRSEGATAPNILSSRPSATLEAINRSDSAAFESAGRYMMRLVTSCITTRRPQNPAGATLRRAFNKVHADGHSTSRRPGPRAANRREESTLHKDLPLRFCSHDQLEFPSDQARITTSPNRSWSNSPLM